MHAFRLQPLSRAGQKLQCMEGLQLEACWEISTAGLIMLSIFLQLQVGQDKGNSGYLLC